MWQCRQCETQNEDQNRYCIICGADQYSSKIEQTDNGAVWSEEKTPAIVPGTAITHKEPPKRPELPFVPKEEPPTTPPVKPEPPKKKSGNMSGIITVAACMLVVIACLGFILIRPHGAKYERWYSLGSICFDRDGLLNGLKDDDGQVRFFENGRAQQGWRTLGKDRHYFTPEGVAAQGWYTVDGTEYYFVEDGAAANGLEKVEGKLYYFEDGEYCTGLIQVDDNSYFFKSNGIAATGWQNCNGEKYYFLEDGKAANGIVDVDGKQYNFIDGQIPVGFQYIDGKKYYFNTDGFAREGLQKINNSIYYFDENGAAAEGLTEVGGDWYYFDEEHAAAIGWQTINGEKYYFQENGKAIVGFGELDTGWYYFDSDGSMVTGLREIKGRFYAFRDDGRMIAEEEVTFGDRTYYFRYDGIATQYSYEVENLHATVSDEQYSFTGYDGNRWNVPYYALDEPVYNCTEMTMKLTITETVEGVTTGLWGLYLWTTDGEWKLACEFNLSGTESVAKQTFRNPVSFYGYSFVLLRQSVQMKTSYRASSSLYDVRSVVYLT